MELTSVADTTALQAALDDSTETADLELTDGTYGTILLPKQKRRVTLRIPVGRVVEWNGDGGPVLRRTDASSDVSIRLIAEGEIRTDREGVVDGEDALGAPTYSKAPLEAISLVGVEELVILGHGTGQEKVTFRGAFSIRGHVLKRYLGQNAETVYVRRRDDGAPIGSAAQRTENQRVRDRQYIAKEWE